NKPQQVLKGQLLLSRKSYWRSIACNFDSNKYSEYFINATHVLFQLKIFYWMIWYTGKSWLAENFSSSTS
ncbi:MAG: hypothetical protein NWS46_01500, partial [Cyclobacteriaceae bacterium]|nr:hypothetical protein [Cyclobacteriaceae bacterium]